VIGLHDYSPAEHSTPAGAGVVSGLGSGAELSFAAGDRLRIIAELDPDLFYEAAHTITGQTGCIPSNFVSLESAEGGALLPTEDGALLPAGNGTLGIPTLQEKPDSA
jgi:hypothetical protein